MAITHMRGLPAVRGRGGVTLGMILLAVAAAAVPSSSPATAGPAAPQAQRPGGGPVAESGPGSLNSVSCVSSSACMAVGVRNNGRAIAEWWDGKGWRLMSPDSQPRSGPVIDVSCIQAANAGPECMAVGTTATHARGPGSRGRAVAALWNGRSWRAFSPPSPGIQGTLGSVSCLSPRWCMAVGGYGRGGGSRYLAEWWNGARWRLLDIPTPAGNVYGGLGGLTCVTHKFCLAVGDYANAKGPIAGLTGVWNGTAWRLLPGHGLGRFTDLSSTACTSTTHCVAVGENSPPQGLQPAAALWNGLSWTTLSLGKLGNGGSLYDVSCPSASSCMAAGLYFAAPDLLLESWNGTSWHVMAGANPGSVNSVLTGVSCSQLHSCMSVGDTQDGYNGPAATLAERWDGSRWHLTVTH